MTDPPEDPHARRETLRRLIAAMEAGQGVEEPDGRGELTETPGGNAVRLAAYRAELAALDASVEDSAVRNARIGRGAPLEVDADHEHPPQRP